MKHYIEKIGSFGAIIAAAACPICFPKLALVGAAFGFGAFGLYEAQFFIAAQILVGIAVVGHILAYRQHRTLWLLALALLSAAAVFCGLYLFSSEAIIYSGFAALVLISSIDVLKRFRSNARSACKE